MKCDPLKLLSDIVSAIEEILEDAEGMNLQDYLQARSKRRAEERCFTIIGEALYVLEKQDSTWATRISSLQNFVRFCHVLVHGYHKVDDEIVWTAVTDDLPLLYRTVSDLRNEPDPPRRESPSSGTKT